MRYTITVMMTSRKIVPGYTVLIDFLTDLTTISFSSSSEYGFISFTASVFQISLMSFVSIGLTFLIVFVIGSLACEFSFRCWNCSFRLFLLSLSRLEIG